MTHLGLLFFSLLLPRFKGEPNPKRKLARKRTNVHIFSSASFTGLFYMYTREGATLLGFFSASSFVSSGGGHVVSLTNRTRNPAKGCYRLGYVSCCIYIDRTRGASYRSGSPLIITLTYMCLFIAAYTVNTVSLFASLLWVNSSA